MRIPFSSLALRLSISALVLGAAGALATSCSKDTETTKDYSSIDDAIIQKYIADSTVTNAQKQSSGLYYVPVVSNPTGVLATAGKTIYVRYTGRFINGQVFDKSGTSPFSFVLGRGNVIGGWDEGIALMRKGEKGKLLIPSKLGYGASGAGTIPPNTVLRFEVEVVNVL